MEYPIFKVPTLNRWIVVVSGKYTEELRQAPDDVLSFDEAARDVSVPRISFRHTHPSIIPEAENRVHSGRTHRKGFMACQDRSRIGK